MSAATKKPRLSRRAMIIDSVIALAIGGMACLGMVALFPNADGSLFVGAGVLGTLIGAAIATQARAVRRQAYEERG